MAKKIKLLPSLSRVVPGARASLEVPLGPTYESILFTVTAAAGLDITDIEEIEVILNGDVRIKYASLQQLFDLNSYYNRAADTNTATKLEFMVHLTSIQYDALAYKLATGIGTIDLSSFNVELKIAAGAPADIAMIATAMIETQPQPIGAFVGLRQFAINSAVSGVVETDKIGKNGEVYHAIHLKKADISRVVLKTDDITVIEASKTILERFQKDAFWLKRVPVTARYTHLDFLLDGNANNVLNTAGVRDVRLQMTFDTSGSADIVAETVEKL